MVKKIAYISIIIMMLCSCKSVENSANSTAYPTPPSVEFPASNGDGADGRLDDLNSPTPSSIQDEEIDTPPEETPQPKPSPKETWTGAEILEYLIAGNVSDTVSFKFGDSKKTAEAELGEVTEEPGITLNPYRYKNIGVQYCPWESDELLQFVTIVAFFEGERFFGLEVGKATPDDVRAVMGPPPAPSMEGYDYGGFTLASSGEREEGDPPPGEKYYFMNYRFKSQSLRTSRTSGNLIFYFTDGILETVAVYGPQE